MIETDRQVDISAKRQIIEDFISENLLTEAFNALQDFVRDYADGIRHDVLGLRIQYEGFLADRRANRASDFTVVHFQQEILKLCARAEDEAAYPRRDTSGLRSALADRPVVAECVKITKRYGKGPFRLDPLSLTVREGEITGVVGRNASGKTSFLRLLMGEILPDDGDVLFPQWTREAADENARSRKTPAKRSEVDWLKLRREISYVPQLPTEWLGRLRQNLNYAGAATERRSLQIQEIIEWNLSRYEMKRFEGSSWNELSGGYRIRFELVRALISNPRLLVLDEPLAYLDVIARQRFLEDLRSIANSLERPVAIVITSQHLSEIEAVADQMLLLNDGKCVFSGPISGIEDYYPHRIIEIAVRAPRHDVEVALTGVTIYSMEKSLEGFILMVDKREDLPRIFARLSAAFGDQFTTFNDITRSSRGLLAEEI